MVFDVSKIGAAGGPSAQKVALFAQAIAAAGVSRKADLPYYLPSDYGTLGAIDDTAPIQAAIDAANAAGGGVVQLPAASIPVSGLLIKTGVRLRGVGSKENSATELKLLNGANTHVIALADAETRMVEVRDLWIDGNKANNTSGSGIYLNSGFYNPNDFAMQDIIVDEVTVRYCKEHGILLRDNGVGPLINAKVSNVNSRYNGKKGFSISGVTDSRFHSLTASWNAEEGFYLGFAGNSRFIDSKSYYNGTSYSSSRPYGWYLDRVRRSTFIGCEAQEDWRYGMYATQIDDCDIGFLADANGREATPGTGIRLLNSTDCLIRLHSTSFHTPTWQSVGLHVSDSTNCSAIITNKNSLVATPLLVTSGNSVEAWINGELQTIAAA